MRGGGVSAMGGQGGNNRKTALVLLSVALVFFLGIMLKTWLVGR